MNISCKFYGFLLLAYPPEFRQKFGSEMLQVFRDSYHLEINRRSLPGFWLWTLFDLIVTAIKERAYDSRKEIMSTNKNMLTLVGCTAIIVIALLLLRYGQRNEIASILWFGYVLDALITAGLIGNVIVFILNIATKLNPLRAALWTFAVVHAVLLVLIVVLVGRKSGVNLTATVIGYLVSFVIWAGLHFALQRRPPVYS